MWAGVADEADRLDGRRVQMQLIVQTQFMTGERLAQLDMFALTEFATRREMNSRVYDASASTSMGEVYGNLRIIKCDVCSEVSHALNFQ